MDSLFGFLAQVIDYLYSIYSVQKYWDEVENYVKIIDENIEILLEKEEEFVDNRDMIQICFRKFSIEIDDYMKEKMKMKKNGTMNAQELKRKNSAHNLRKLSGDLIQQANQAIIRRDSKNATKKQNTKTIVELSQLSQQQIVNEPIQTIRKSSKDTTILNYNQINEKERSPSKQPMGLPHQRSQLSNIRPEVLLRKNTNEISTIIPSSCICSKR